MPSDEKRREVAEDLRYLTIRPYIRYKEQFFDELADLIEPEPERTCHAITTAKPFSQTQELRTKSCSSCGYIFESEAHRRMPPYYGEMGAIRATTLPNYCQCCGAKVER